MAAVLLFLILLVTVFASSLAKKYQPTWESLDSRPLPQWYDDVKLGIFITYGVYSVPSFGNEWFWYRWKALQRKDVVDFMAENYRPDFTFADFAAELKAEFYDPDQWVEMFNASGAGYIVFVTKHHSGFTNWPSKYSFNWNSMDNGPNRDIVGELAKALRAKTNIHLGLYHSLFEWFHPLYLKDKKNNYTTQEFVDSKTMPELYELVNNYQPDVVWSDGEWEASDTYWKSREFLAWLYNSSPVKDSVVTNDRWGKEDRCKHGGVFTCTDKYNPGVLQKYKWENAMTLDRGSWGFRRNAPLSDYLTIEELLETLASTVSCGGNLLMNVGPTSDGRIDPIYEERLRQMGSWLQVNGEAIYKSRPWSHQNDTVTRGVWYTSKRDLSGKRTVYAILLNIPKSPVVLGAPSPSDSSTTVTMLGYRGNFHWERYGDGMVISIPPITIDKMPCKWAWVLKITSIVN